MKRILFVLTVLTLSSVNLYAMNYRGIVYDVGLQYNPGEYSVETFNPELVKYDIGTIRNILRANAIRIEGEDIDRLVKASEIAAEAGLKVFFNPWWMNADSIQVVEYMEKAARAAEQLRAKGYDITFVTGCEYSLFNNGIFPGNSVNERLGSMMSLGELKDDPEKLSSAISEMTDKLNSILKTIVGKVRENFRGDVIYSAGTWEPVDWTLFDAVGVDYYRDTQSEEQYIAGIKEYMKYGKPVWVMEVGCCAFEGASALGGAGFTVCQGVDENGNGIYIGGSVPKRSEKEQADYDEKQIRLLNDSGIEGMFIFEFSFPIAPYRENGLDSDLTAYPIVKSFPKDDPRTLQMPPWEPKEAFFRVGQVYSELEQQENNGIEKANLSK